MIQGKNVKKLIVHRMSGMAIPKGGGIQDAVNFLSSKDRILNVARDATAWVEQAIRLVREATEPNPWKDRDDEAIAGEILRQIAEKGKKP